MTKRGRFKAFKLPPSPDFRFAAAIAFGAGLAAGLFQTLSFALLPPQLDSDLENTIEITEPSSKH